LRGIFLISCGILMLAYSFCGAVEPSTKPQETPASELVRDREGATLPFPEQVVAGEVIGSDRKPIGGVMVKLFADGRLIEIAHTTASGSYEMKLPLSIEKDETVVMWFMASTDDLLPQCVLLKESAAARRAGLFSKCTPEVDMRPQMRVDMTLVTEAEFVASLKVKDCM
jgi:hypothetical protein